MSLRRLQDPLHCSLSVAHAAAPSGVAVEGCASAPGDLVRWLPDGNLEFLGRLDNQVPSELASASVAGRAELQALHVCPDMGSFPDRTEQPLLHVA